ncbi:hypothetical protein EX895_006576 [Sporisorium graminicola]|uniref:Uncharacterized protein n=1 Tax=Sporisorium graminicola TaxID=280036 RepID=A0A4U7KL02_9BASI|nr:hypothetical protein EX895_006576 [Sporisorium graminicola]TKY84674.1 hypothetical protein EX895_006576 [Sporisorium graminicola]
MVTQAESSKPSVNERLARAREEDLRRCRNLQAKLARAQLHDEDHLGPPAATPKQRLITDHVTSSSSQRTGLMFLLSTEQAQRERDQRSRERQLKRQVAGPIPPESWRDDFDRLSIRKGVASHFDRQLLQDLISSTAAAGEGGDDADGTSPNNGDALERERELRQRARKHRAAICAGLRYHHNLADDGAGVPEILSLRDMTLCVIADALNRPSLASMGQGRDHGLAPDMDRAQLREVLEYLPRHIRDRMLALCGRLAATEWPLSEWTARALVDLHRRQDITLERSQTPPNQEADEDWENSIDSDPYPTAFSFTTSKGATTATGILDLSFAAVSPRTIHRMLSSSISTAAFSLTTLSLAGYNTSPAANNSSLDSPQMHSIFASLPNLRVLSLAGSRLSSRRDDVGDGGDSQRAAVFLRKLSRSLGKLEMLDLGGCAWVCADAVLAVSWANGAWPRLKCLLLTGCEAVVDPRVAKDTLELGDASVWRPAGNHVAPWHATHSQRDVLHTNDQPATREGALYDAYTDNLHRDPFDLFAAPVQLRTAGRATFGDYVTHAIQPAIITHMTPTPPNGPTNSVLMEYVRCPRSAGKVEMWQWQRARILDAVRGRAQPSAKRRGWIDVYF